MAPIAETLSNKADEQLSALRSQVAALTKQLSEQSARKTLNGATKIARQIGSEAGERLSPAVSTMRENPAVTGTFIVSLAALGVFALYWFASAPKKPPQRWSF
jgi:hypothetical protein